MRDPYPDPYQMHTDQQPSFNPSIIEFFNDEVLLLLLPPVLQVRVVLAKALL
jgi:hypothetical protein